MACLLVLWHSFVRCVMIVIDIVSATLYFMLDQVVGLDHYCDTWPVHFSFREISPS